MSDAHGGSEPGESALDWLTPTAAAIAGFTVAVLSLLSNGAWLLALQAFIQRNGSAAFEDVVMATGVGQGVLGGRGARPWPSVAWTPPPTRPATSGAPAWSWAPSVCWSPS